LIDVAGAPAKGAAGARVAIVEFSDYQCPFCGRFYRDSLVQIQKEYIDTGKIRYVFRNLPLEAIHPNAFKASEAALCAGDQGKYWQMHDQLFQNQRALDPDALVAHAKAVGLDVAAFQQCLGSGKHEKRIRADMADAEALGANGTPAFFVGTTAPGDKVKSGRFISGARPYADFKAAIDAALAQ
jgi:protein-disulfide isomerase